MLKSKVRIAVCAVAVVGAFSVGTTSASAASALPSGTNVGALCSKVTNVQLNAACNKGVAALTSNRGGFVNKIKGLVTTLLSSLKAKLPSFTLPSGGNSGLPSNISSLLSGGGLGNLSNLLSGFLKR